MQVKCNNCNKEFNKKLSHIYNTNFCCRKCMGEFMSKNNIGKNNGNKKYFFDENIFKNIDNEFKAWILGWIASDGSLGKNKISIAVDKKDIDILEIIQKQFCKDIPIKTKKNDKIVYYTISSKIILKDILYIFNLNNYGKKSNILTSINISDNFIRHFIRGFFEGDGYIKISRNPECGISSNSLEILEFINEKSGNFGKINKDRLGYSLYYYGVNALDFLGYIYNKSEFKMKRKYKLYDNICLWERKIDGKESIIKRDNAYFYKTRKDSVFPFKSRVSDSGYDLTLLSLEKKFGEIELYDTGIKVCPPFGYYFDLVPRSSIIKSGYILANSIGIIDRSYLGAIKVPLIKIDKNSPDLQLPCRLVQIIPRKIEHYEFIESEKLSETSRGDGGFGSTGEK